MYASRSPIVRRSVVREAPSAAEAFGVGPGEQILWILFMAAHAPLAVLARDYSIVVFFHGALAFGTGLWFARNPRRPEVVAYAAAYIVGSEVLWRMVTDALPWESAKYGTTVIFAFALLVREGVKGLLWPALAFGLLVPSTFVTMSEAHPTLVRGMLSFNMSGPLSLAVCAGFFARLELSPSRTLRLFLSLVAPAVAIGTMVVTHIASLDRIAFNYESNFSTSGGFGPNQVSLALGLGALAALWSVLERGCRWPLRCVLFGLVLWFGTQAALTFSRGGFLGAVVSGAVAVVFLAGYRETRRKLVFIVPVVAALAYFVIWPTLVEFTDGALAVRYGDTGVTGRDELGAQDFELWSDHPIFGVGPGMSASHHARGIASHTEFTRLVAEHGTFGALSILMMLSLGFRQVLRAASPRDKGLVASALTWSFLFMLNSAMRTVAPSFMFGLAFCIFEPTSGVVREARQVVRSMFRRRHIGDSGQTGRWPTGAAGVPVGKVV